MKMQGAIPVIDCNNDIGSVSNEILEAFQTIGFVYLKNFGISDTEIDEAFRVSDEFWSMPTNVKRQYAKPKEYAKEGFTGYVAPDVEILDEQYTREVRESFDIAPFDKLNMKLPSDVVPNFDHLLLSFLHKCHKVAIEILRAIASALNFEDPEIFTKIHRLTSESENMTSLRLLHYPPVPSNADNITGRLGAHTDYGTITLLFQDDVGGLEVCDKTGQYVPAIPLPSAVLVNGGDLLQRWTNDQIVANKHRVLVPTDKSLWGRERRSIVLFVHPDSSHIIQSTSGKYSPTTSKKHLLDMFGKTFY